MNTTNPGNLLIANWKMNLSVKQTVILTKALLKGVSSLGKFLDFNLVLCPTFPALPLVGALLKKTANIYLGAQNVFWKGHGPYTGEVSAEVLSELGVRYVIVGHSERRQYLKETDEMIRHKIMAALQYKLTPVLCLGETYAQRQAGQRDVILHQQLSRALAGFSLTNKQNLVIAYEPVWAIGSGQAVSQSDMLQAAEVIEQGLRHMWPSEQVSSQVRIIYGGSVDDTNIKTCVNQGRLSGALVGGASLQAAGFIKLLRQVA